MKKLKFLTLLTLLISFTAFSQTTKEGWTTKALDNYSIQYPQDWEFDDSGQLGTQFLIFSPQKTAADAFRENINLFVQDLTDKGIDLDKFVEITEEQVKTFFTGGKILSSERIKSGDSEYHKIVYIGKQGKYDLKFEQYYQIVNEKAYVLTLTCELSQFEKYQKTGEGILNSFKLK